MTAVAVTFLICASVVIIAILRRSPAATPTPMRSILDERLLDTVVVTLKSGTTFSGALYAEDEGAVVLCNASQLQRDGTLVPADGEIVLFRSDVDFIQRP